ncbi:unnamed protein product [Arabis nemorensis]|uniref:Uncharacterized protein n=1 Tax=Arabis nemorensis TaxID=586526 RepID=A0A565AZF9_9BRAS|nr:unnamed protein product [Arabis nemorensis]
METKAILLEKLTARSWIEISTEETERNIEGEFNSHSLSRTSHTPPPNPQRDPVSLTGLPAIAEEETTPRSRRPALEWISQPRTPVFQRLGEATSVDLSHLQDIVYQYETGHEQALEENRIPASSRVIEPTEFDSVQITIPRDTMAEEKKKNKRIRTPAKNWIGSSPLVGACSRKRNVSRVLNPAKKKPAIVGAEFLDTEFVNHYTIPLIGSSGGLALIWNNNVEIQVLDCSPNHIDTKIRNKNQSSFITFIYGPSQTEIRQTFWDLISARGMEFRAIMEKLWKGSVPESVNRKLDRCRNVIIKWAKKKRKNNPKEIKKAQQKLDEALSADFPNDDLITNITQRLESFL